MAQFYLDRDAKSEIGYSSTPVTVNGTAGNADRILLRGNAANVTVGAAVEIVDLYGPLSSYSFARAGNGVAVYRDGLLVATVASNEKGSELRFTDGGLKLEQAETGAFLLGGWEVSGTAEAPEAWAGENDEINTDHKSEAGGGSGPVPGPGGKGEEYTLPGDLGEGNVISSGTGDDTYTGTLPKDAQIVDASATDNDTLNMSYNRTNDNGVISNVENINATWTAYNGKAVFDAENVQHMNGANITVNSSRAGATDALVNMVQNHHVIAGANITGELTVGDADTGARVTMNNASALVIQTELNSPSKEAITVNAEKDFDLKLANPNGKGLPDYFQNNAADNGDQAISSDRAEKAILVNAGKDLTITLDASLLQGPTNTSATDDQVAANIISTGSGKVTADIGTVKTKAATASDPATWQNISGLQVDVVKMRGTTANNLVVDRGQHLDLATTTGDYAFAMQVHTDDDRATREGKSNSYELTADLSAGNKYSKFDIRDGNIGTLNLVLSGDTIVDEVVGAGEDAKDTQFPVRLADAFVFSGKGNATVLKMTQASETIDGATVLLGEGGPTVAAADGFKGLLTVGQAGSGNGVSNGTIAGGDGGTLVYAGSVGAGQKLAHLGGSGVDTLEFNQATTVSGANAALLFDGGAGNDKVDIKAGLTVSGSTSSATFNMGAGDDVITLKGSLSATSGGKIAIDFGDGAADTLKVEDTINVSGSGKDLIIRNMDVLDLSSSDGNLTIRQDQVDAWDFQIKGAGAPTKLVVALDGANDLDLSGLKVSDTATSHMTVSGGATNYAATITLDKVGVHTTIQLSGSGATAERHLAIDGFKGHEDVLDLQALKPTNWNTTVTFQGTTSAGFSAVSSEWKSLDEVLRNMAEKNTGTSGDLIGFKFEGSTYFLVENGNGKFDAADTVIRLVGDKYEATDLSVSGGGATGGDTIILA